MRYSSALLVLSGVAYFTAGSIQAGTLDAVTEKAARLPVPKQLVMNHETAAIPAQAEKRPLTYRPPLRGAPTRRIGGSSRSPGVPPVRLAVFATESTGLTMQAQPTLYWYVSKPVDMTAEFTLTDPDRIRPVLRAVIEPPIEARVHAVSLSRHGVRLKPGTDYEWSVALIPDPRRRSRDIVSSGTIRHIQPSGRVVERIRRAGRSESQFVFAEEGLWYDALAAVSNDIADRPRDPDLIDQRAALLRQVGLQEVVTLVDRRR